MKKVYCFWLDEVVPIHDASTTPSMGCAGIAGPALIPWRRREMMRPIVEEGICTLCGKRTKVALFELWEDQDRGMVEMNVSFCAACLVNTLKEIRNHPEDIKTTVRRNLSTSIQHLYNAIEKIEHGEAGSCLEEIHQAVDRACDAVEAIERG